LERSNCKGNERTIGQGPDNIVRIGVIGVGRIGAFHAAVLSEHAEVAEVTVVDMDGERARAVAGACGARVVGSLEDLLGCVDAVVITAPTAQHAELIRHASDAGLPAFCEKPIALDLESTREVVERVRRAGTVVQMGFQRRFDAGYRRARERVADGSVGRIYVVRLAGHDPSPPHESYVPDSGGLFRDLHIHDFDIARWVTGREIVEVYADGGVLGFEFFARYDDVDSAVAVLRFDDGALGLVSGARHDPLGYDIRMEVFGSGDSIAVGLDARTPLRSMEEGGPPVSERPYSFFLDRFEPAYRSELDAFVDVVAGRRENPCPPEEALEAMRVAIACDVSRREHRPVRVAEVG
jgi:myo-inositol 2-dehydrogenase/D-chiro-inositol 1-dehydrogenase